jgi:hypothetical protein
MAFVIGIVSVIVVALGVLAMVASAMPSFGGRRDDTTALAVGLILFFAGIAGVFYAGSWL